MMMLEADYSTPSSSKNQSSSYVSKATFKKWQRETRNNYETISWLCREVKKMPEHCVCKLFALIAKGMKITSYIAIAQCLSTLYEKAIAT